MRVVISTMEEVMKKIIISLFLIVALVFVGGCAHTQSNNMKKSKSQEILLYYWEGYPVRCVTFRDSIVCDFGE